MGVSESTGRMYQVPASEGTPRTARVRNEGAYICIFIRYLRTHGLFVFAKFQYLS